MSTQERIVFQGAGVEIVGSASGPADGPPILFLHGAGQTRHSWGKAIDEAARRGFRAIAIDSRGHGDSGWSPDGQYGLDRYAEDARRVVEQVGSKPIFVGASMGGSTGIMLAADQDSPLRALVLVDITARVEPEASQEVMGFMGSAQQGFASLDEAADAVSAYLPHRPRPKNTDGLAKNLRFRDGRYYWHWDPAFLSMGRRSGEQESYQTRIQAAAQSLTIPTLLVRGGKSRIVTEKGAREFLELVPHAEFFNVADADHMVAGDDNDAFNAAVFDFIGRLDASTAA
jgi:pimeloyl-ACP methyl ester carboxylesterase